MLKIYNTLTRKKEIFRPIIAGKVGLYVCGMTVYDYCHIGHARVMVIFDTVARYFRYCDYDLTYVRNITDIDDKIIKRAHENGEDCKQLTARYIVAMHEDERSLNVLPPDLEPKATQSINDIIRMIMALFEQKLAYAGTNGDIFYAVTKFDRYGKLSGKNIEDLQAGERVDINQSKRDPLDFTLWKQAKLGEPCWNSPWGKGRPGWHIECSAMSTTCLGDHFDIHGGGMDLQFPHHENEIAQSEGATGKKFVNLWMHNGFVRVDDAKMSKSLGNFFSVRKVLQKYRAEVIRFLIISSHYRSPLNYSDASLNEAEAALRRLYTALRNVTRSYKPIEHYQKSFQQAMDDDFNTVLAVAVLFEVASELNKAKVSNAQQAPALATTLHNLGAILGILQDSPDDYLQSKISDKPKINLDQPTPCPATKIEEMIQLRLVAKQNKDWAKADQIRAYLKRHGVILEDNVTSTTWRRV